MPITAGTYYGSVAGADEYFANSIHNDWATIPAAKKEPALLAATRDIDALVFEGAKTSSTQLLEFPRDAATSVPAAIIEACYEIALERAKGRNPEIEYCNLWLNNDGASLKSSTAGFDRQSMPPKHTAHMILSPIAWRLLMPYLVADPTFTIKRE